MVVTHDCKRCDWLPFRFLCRRRSSCWLLPHAAACWPNCARSAQLLTATCKCVFRTLLRDRGILYRLSATCWFFQANIWYPRQHVKGSVTVSTFIFGVFACLFFLFPPLPAVKRLKLWYCVWQSVCNSHVISIKRIYGWWIHMTSTELRASRLCLANPDCVWVSSIYTSNSCGYIQVKSTEFISSDLENKKKSGKIVLIAVISATLFPYFFRRYYGRGRI